MYSILFHRFFDGLPIQDINWVQGFGASSFAENNPSKYAAAGLHSGMDFGKAYDPDCATCNNVFSTVAGTVTFKYFTEDADPNVVLT
ncbi:MAG: hypothetical protein IPK53_10295 [bacterium]|nr:hypothetical protein [bacterium]